MFLLTKKFRFEAAHQLVNHDGKCARRHGHSFRGEIIVVGDKLAPDGPKEGMAIDYGDLGKITDYLEEQLDHRDLNEVVCSVAPTSEKIARWCYDQIQFQFKTMLDNSSCYLGAVVIEETCTTRCEYSR